MHTYKLYTVSEAITIKNCSSEDEAYSKLERASGISRKDIWKIEKC